MGYIRHNAIVVTGHIWNHLEDGEETDIRCAHAKAEEIGLLVSPIVEGATNATGSFFVAPDGSKEGWETSDEFDAMRDGFVQWLREKSRLGEEWFSWAEVILGSDDCEAKIDRHAWDEQAIGSHD